MRPTKIYPPTKGAKFASSRPVYGLIFLFKWREEDPDKQEPSCPEGIWFANQVLFDLLLPRWQLLKGFRLSTMLVPVWHC